MKCPMPYVSCLEILAMFVAARAESSTWRMRRKSKSRPWRPEKLVWQSKHDGEIVDRSMIEIVTFQFTVYTYLYKYIHIYIYTNNLQYLGELQRSHWDVTKIVVSRSNYLKISRLVIYCNSAMYCSIILNITYIYIYI